MLLKLSVSQILLTTTWLVYNQYQALLKVLIFPIIILVGAILAFYILTDEANIFISNSDDSMITITLKNYFHILSYAIVCAIFSAPFSVSCHRFVLGIDLTTENERFFWTKRETRFAIFSVMIFITTFIIFVVLLLMLIFPISAASTFIENPLAITYLVSYVGPSIAIIVTSYIACRVSIIFPSIAVDKPLTIRLAWEISRHNGWRLLIIASIFYFIQMALYTLIDAESIGSVLVSIILSCTLSIFGIIALSISYFELQKKSINM